MSTMVFPPCPHEDCDFIGHHWHDVDGSIESHMESPCTDPWSPTNWMGCVDTHEPEPDPTEVMGEAHPHYHLQPGSHQAQK